MNTKEVNFNKWCHECEYEGLEENEEPCDICLNTCYRYDSTKPVEFVKKDLTTVD